jgi:Protein of unknown function (DUF1553)/Protein of unknown function (DUF1549)/Planctomycete cytochrome C
MMPLVESRVFPCRRKISIVTNYQHGFCSFKRFAHAWRILFLRAAKLALCLSVSPLRADPPLIEFNRDVAPILINNCLECHHRGKASGGLNLTLIEEIRRGGESGPAITIDPSTPSLMLAKIDSGEMPPQENQKRQPLTPEQVATLRSWVKNGAEWPKNRELGLHEQTVQVDNARHFWSFQPVRRRPVPQVQQTDGAVNPIDAFIEVRLSKMGVDPVAMAMPHHLMRRAWMDLVGRPPSLDEQERFLNDSSSTAYEDLVDRLLVNPGYGERWGRYWLDLVRYADSNGYERDGPKPGVWRYRDYVIESLNRDKPYDRFVLEQLAGDELPDRSQRTVIATGFHALGAWQDEVDPLEAAQYRADELDDMLRTTAQTFLGLTIGCARCHNHKFDPISMVDYYSFSAILAPLKRPNVGRDDRDRPLGSFAELAAVQNRDKQIADLNQLITQLRSKTEAMWLESGRSQLPAEAIAALRSPAKERNLSQNQLIQKHATRWQAEITTAMPEDIRQQVAENERLIQKLRQEIPDLPRGYFLYEDSPDPEPTFLLLSGRASNRGPQMQPAVPLVLTSSQPSIVPVQGQTSGRRLALARWLVDPANPLTARVIVNRVWQHHFGEGIVATPSDFGQMGSRATHPELLDWLADWFVNDGQWSLKKLHRLIMTSRTYRRSSMATKQLQQLDPENKWLGRFPQRRLEAEAIRDSVLAISGKLNPEMFGPAVHLPIPASVIEAHTDKEAAWRISPEPAIYRRTIYAYLKRTLLVPMLEVLDLCDTTNSVDKRSITSIAPQALTLFNGEFMNSQAAFFADRVIREVGDDSNQQIERAYRLALCRMPTPTELQTLTQFLIEEAENRAFVDAVDARRAALIQICRVILNLNEFVYVE